VSDLRHGLAVQPPVKTTGPLGLCNPCCAARKQDPEQPVREAVTLVPATVPIPGPGGQIMGIGVVALPHCWEHIPGPSAGAAPRLLVANGEIPRA
jgi:hypothetical protein